MGWPDLTVHAVRWAVRRRLLDEWNKRMNNLDVAARGVWYRMGEVMMRVVTTLWFETAMCLETHFSLLRSRL